MIQATPEQTQGINALAFVFPGQGSQEPGMLKDLFSQFSSVRDVFEQASDILGWNVWDLAHLGTAEEMADTRKTQPLMLVADIAVWSAWCQHTQQRPTWVAGHSLGEYAALVASHAITFSDALRAVEVRANAMHDVSVHQPGGMLAVLGLTFEHVAAVCTQIQDSNVLNGDSGIWPANINGHKQIVVGGDIQSLEKATPLFISAGALKVVNVKMSVPSHCPLMQPVAQKLKPVLESISIKTPQINIIANLTGKPVKTADEIRHALTEQITQPVQWVQTIETLQANAITQCAECGPGKVLQGLGRRIEKNITHFGLDSSIFLQEGIELVQHNVVSTC
ncbi:MAG: ACP S-malonyltransferase [Pseudomonadota bacterium]